MLKLYQFPRPKPSSVPNFSPFCVKLETYLKMAEIPYESKPTFDFSKSPKNLMPYIEIDGQFKGDSALIIDFLKEKYGDKIDSELSAEQQAIATGFIGMLENHLGPFVFYFRWVDNEGWPQFREMIFAKSPKLIKLLVGYQLSKKAAKRMHLQGTSRFTQDEMLYLAQKDLNALSVYLADKSFFFGDKPTLLDIVCFAVYSGIIFVPIETKLKQLAIASQFANLQQHSKRMLEKFYSN